MNYDEYKLMGLAPYGKPRYVDRIWQHLIQRRADGSFRINTRFFGFLDSDRMTNAEFEHLFDGQPRVPGSIITRREMDLAASVQEVLEQMLLGLARHAREITGMEHLVVAGGVALNCAAMGRLYRERIFRRLWIQPAAGDAGGAIGAALLASYLDFGVRRRLDARGADSQKGSYLGPAFSSSEVRAFLDRGQYPYEIIEDRRERSRRIARTLAGGGIVGYFSGRMEFGPRALGARSILADPRRTSSHLRINLKTKRRESFRPLAPTVLAEKSEEYFEISDESPYMLLVVPVRKERRNALGSEVLPLEDENLLGLIQQPRSDIPAVTHVDYSARVQTIRKDDNPNYYEVVKAFEEITGCGVIVNTSFNLRGEPVVCTPLDAYRCFMDTDMDLLVLEDCLIRKSAAIKEGKPEVFLESEARHGVGASGSDERALCSFFFERLVPAAESLRQRKVSLLSVDAGDAANNRHAESWYVNCPEGVAKLTTREPADLENDLLRLWAHQGPSELSGLVEPLIALSQQLQSTDYTHRAKPAPFIYAMY